MRKGYSKLNKEWEEVEILGDREEYTMNDEKYTCFLVKHPSGKIYEDSQVYELPKNKV